MKYPTERNKAMSITGIEIELIGQDGNAFNIMGIATKALKRNGHADLVSVYMEEAMAGDYDHLLRTTMKYFEVN
jgi:hypothetical protein